MEELLEEALLEEGGSELEELDELDDGGGATDASGKVYCTSSPVSERRGSRSLGIVPPLVVRKASGVTTVNVTPVASRGRVAETK